jgi:hypothetical protein
MSGFFGMLIPSGGGGSGPPPVTPSEYIGYAGPQPPRLKVCNWNSDTGMGSFFSSPTVFDSPREISFVPDNSTISIAGGNSPWIYVWQWSSLGFGTRYSNPSSLLNPNLRGPSGYSWTTNIDALITANASESLSYPQAWAWNSASGFGTKYSNGTSLQFAESIAVNGDSSLVAINASLSPWIHLYPWSVTTGFGTKYSTPSFSGGLPVSSGFLQLSFNKVTNDLALGQQSSPYIWACGVTSAGFGTKYSSPSTTLASATNQLLFSPDGSAVGTVNRGAPALNAYRWGAGFGTKYVDPVNLTLTNQFGIDWSSTTNAIVGTSSQTTPYTNIYKWSVDGFGTKYSVSSSVPVNATVVSFSNKSR